MAQMFEGMREGRREYRHFNTMGTQLTVRLNPVDAPDLNTVDYFLVSVNELFDHALQDVGDWDMLGIAIHNKMNQNDKTIGISYPSK